MPSKNDPKSHKKKKEPQEKTRLIKKTVNSKSKLLKEKPLDPQEPHLTPSEGNEFEEPEDQGISSSQNNPAGRFTAAQNHSTEMSSSFKNFRHHPDMENFYRFIYENDLRHEALFIINEIMAEKEKRKILKGGKTQAH